MVSFSARRRASVSSSDGSLATSRRRERGSSLTRNRSNGYFSLGRASSAKSCFSLAYSNSIVSKSLPSALSAFTKFSNFSPISRVVYPWNLPENLFKIILSFNGWSRYPKSSLKKCLMLFNSLIQYCSSPSVLILREVPKLISFGPSSFGI